MAFRITDLNLEEGTGFLPSYWSDTKEHPVLWIQYGTKIEPAAEHLLSQETDFLDENLIKYKPFVELTKSFLDLNGYSAKQVTSPVPLPVVYAEPKRSIRSMGMHGAGDTLWFDLTDLDGIKIFFPDIKESPVNWDEVNPKTIDIIADYGRILNLVSKEIPEGVLRQKSESMPTRSSYHALMAQV